MFPMKRSTVVRRLARYMVLTYVRHIKEELNNNNELYVASGIDTDFSKYSELFTLVMRKSLGLDYTGTEKFDFRLVADLVNIMNKVIDKTRSSKYITHLAVAEAVYAICNHVLKKYEEEEEINSEWFGGITDDKHM